MAKVSACNQRYPSIDRVGRLGDCSTESQMLIIRLKREPYDYYRPAPARFVEIIQRHQRSVIDRIVSIELAQFDALVRGRLFDSPQHIEIIMKCQPHRGRRKLTEVA